MGQALYRKYRSKSLDEIVGQEHITETLSTALKNGRISHAYLFTGPRGVGKTSIARILAHEINGLPYTDDSAHMDIIEIDAASNRRIDEIRELRDKVYVAPTSAKYKVYIIDEVHMLTKEAFNALLKTLEEPPAHVVFILATTDMHKLPETIVSRTQHYSFKPAESTKVVDLLRTIATKEQIAIEDTALAFLAEHGGGSFRDSVSMLDQASNYGSNVTIADVQRLLGIPSTEAVEILLNTVANSGSSATVMTQLVAMYDQGFQAAAIAKQIAGLLRGQLVSNSLVLPYGTALQLLTKLLEVPIAYDSARYLEICLLQVQVGIASTSVQKPVVLPTAPQAAALVPAPKIETKTEAKVDAMTETKVEARKEGKREDRIEDKIEAKKAALTEAELAPPKPSISEPSADDVEIWQQILTVLKAKHNTLYGLLRMAQPDFSKKGQLCLTFAFDFHRKRVSDVQNQTKLHDIIKEVTGHNLKIECLFDKTATAAAANTAPVAVAKPTSASLANISNIFGGGELVE
jgi:DNA polymerase-3 subunit gamma/tau